MVDLDVEPHHAVRHFFTSSLLAVERERRRPSLWAEVASDNEVPFPLRSFQLDFDIARFLVIFDERTDLAGAIQDLLNISAWSRARRVDGRQEANST